jgi:hypothetical protein
VQKNALRWIEPPSKKFYQISKTVGTGQWVLFVLTDEGNKKTFAILFINSVSLFFYFEESPRNILLRSLIVSQNIYRISEITLFHFQSLLKVVAF